MGYTTNGNLVLNHSNPFQAPKETNNYFVEPYTDFVQLAGGIDFQWWMIRFNDRNEDGVINYVDQYPDTDEIYDVGTMMPKYNLVGLGNHLGPTDVNLSEWHAPLKLVVQSNNNAGN